MASYYSPNTFYVSNGSSWNDTYASAATYTIHTGTSTAPLSPKPRTEVDLLMEDVEQVCQMARAA